MEIKLTNLHSNRISNSFALISNLNSSPLFWNKKRSNHISHPVSGPIFLNPSFVSHLVQIHEGDVNNEIGICSPSPLQLPKSTKSDYIGVTSLKFVRILIISKCIQFFPPFWDWSVKDLHLYIFTSPHPQP